MIVFQHKEKEKPHTLFLAERDNDSIKDNCYSKLIPTPSHIFYDIHPPYLNCYYTIRN